MMTVHLPLSIPMCVCVCLLLQYSRVWLGKQGQVTEVARLRQTEFECIMLLRQLLAYFLDHNATQLGDFGGLRMSVC